MAMLDALDRRMLELLASDARMPVATLAAQLDISRGTAQTRLARLISGGVIRRFTIEVSTPILEGQVRAVTTIQLRDAHTRGVLKRIQAVPAVQAVHTTNGKWDLVAELTANGLEDLDDALTSIRTIAGVTNTETSILLRSV